MLSQSTGVSTPSAFKSPGPLISHPSDPQCFPKLPLDLAHSLTISDYFAHGFEEVVALGSI